MLVLSGLVSLLAAAGVPAPQQLPVFTAEARVVNLSVSVVDPAGHYVPGLSRNDFLIHEDSYPQEVSFFQADPVLLDVVLLLDNSGSMRNYRSFIRSTALAFVQSLERLDHVAVMMFAKDVNEACSFTSDRSVIERSLSAEFPGDGGTHLQRALAVALSELRQHDAQEQRRRVVVLLSDGLDNDVLSDDDWLLRQASLSDATVYIIQTAPPSSTPDRELHDASYFLTTLAKQTGGSMMVLPHGGVERLFLAELSAAFMRISAELRAQYRIGYSPSPERPGGTWRNISISVANGRATRYRLRYYAPKPR